ncbi:MAG: hypothetical protein HKM06_04650 [Spirochaetales bacterium]|nr:hypothetical protein [Spirochaetales bacterium]
MTKLSFSSWNQQGWVFSPDSNQPNFTTWNTASVAGTWGLFQWEGEALAASGADARGFFSPNPWIDADLYTLALSYSTVLYPDSQPLLISAFIGRKIFSEASLWLLNQPLDGGGLEFSQDTWNFHLEAGWDGFLSKQISRMQMTNADLTDRTSSTVWFAPPRSVFSAWQNIQFVQNSEFWAGVLVVHDFRDSGIVKGGDVNYIPGASGTYGGKYYWARWDSRSFLDFDLKGIWEMGNTLLYQLNDSKYENFPVQAWSIGGDLGSSDFWEGMRLRGIFRYSSGDSSERLAYAEASPTWGNVTHLFRPPDADPYSIAFPAEPGNLQWYGLVFDLKGSQLPIHIPLLLNIKLRSLWRSLLGPVDATGGNPQSQDYYLGWSWDQAFTWILDEHWELRWDQAAFFPNSSAQGYWMGQAPAWVAASEFSFHWTW